MMAEDEGDMPSVLVSVGESFVAQDEDEASAFVEAEQEKLKARKEELEGELSRMGKRMGELKKVLYGRFGKAIHLESE